MANLFPQKTVRPLIVLLSGMLFYLIYLAASWGIADIAAYQSRALMQQWSQNQTGLTDESWIEAQQYLSTAREYAPNNPEYLAMTGNLHEWRALIKNREPANILNDYKVALSYYRLALQKRPAFAYYWANIAVVKAILGEIDQEYYKAVEQSLKFGGWEPGVQLKIADATLSVWYMLDEKGWSKMLENIEKALQSNPKAVMELAKKYQVFRQLCAKLRRTEAMLTYCQ